MPKKETTHTCPRRRSKKSMAWMPAILVAILPKCPFCIMAYTGAVSLCSGNTLYPNQGSGSIYIILALSFLVCIGIAFNRRGSRTLVALLLSGLGILVIAYSQFIIFSSALYYVGVFFLFFGIWYNGSFYYFFEKFKQKKYHFIKSKSQVLNKL